MKVRLLTLFALVFILLSCKNEDEINPEALTRSQWQKVIEVSKANQTYDLVYSIDFESDGKVSSEAFFRDIKTKVVMGYVEYFTGNYQIIGNKIEVTILEFHINQVSEELFLEKEKLSLVEGGNLSREFELRNKNSELHTIMPLYASSLGLIYKRVDK